MDIKEGERVLDVATGTGNVAIPAAAAGGVVTGLDITPKLLEDARRNAAAAGVEAEWVEGDAQDLPFEDGSFDVVVSTFGCMFAPDHKRAAGEIARVLAPGGRFGVVAWKPEGNIGRFFLTIAKYAPPPPEGFQPPPLWGMRDHVEEIFDGTGVELSFEDGAAHWHFGSDEEAVEEYSTKFGPIVMLRPQLEADGRWDDLVADLQRDVRGGGRPRERRHRLRRRVPDDVRRQGLKRPRRARAQPSGWRMVGLRLAAASSRRLTGVV